jgi:hypothetical protein
LTFSYYRSAKEFKELKQGKSIDKTSSTTLQTETAADTKVVDTATFNHDLSKPESSSGITTLQVKTAADTKVVDTAIFNHDLSKPESSSAAATPFSPLAKPTKSVSIPIPTVDATCSAVIASYTVRNALLGCPFSSNPFLLFRS